MTSSSKLYKNGSLNPTTLNSDKTKQNLGICFSGGGSRALTCAWGQMLGLKNLNLLENARYISSVSGGTWASSIYTYLPTSIDENELLGEYHTPENLSLSNTPNKFNINSMSKYSFAQAPNNMSLENLLKRVGIFLLLNSFNKKNYKWLWANIVSNMILKLYNLQEKGSHSWSSENSFTLSKEYLKNFPKNAPTKLFFVNNQKRPFIVMNNNIMYKKNTNIIQIPNQVTPIAGGARGVTPDSGFIGGGLTESYGVCSTFSSLESSDFANISINQPYSLIDIVSTSSAFFAQTIAKLFIEHIQDSDKRRVLVQSIKDELDHFTLKSLKSDLKSSEALLLLDMEKKLESIITKDFDLNLVVPSYNYWDVSCSPTNKEMLYTDGGTLENTGILGLVAQTDEKDAKPLKILAFDNTSTPLEKKMGK